MASELPSFLSGLGMFGWGTTSLFIGELAISQKAKHQEKGWSQRYHSRSLLFELLHSCLVIQKLPQTSIEFVALYLIN
jgi:hypothetical protein